MAVGWEVRRHRQTQLPIQCYSNICGKQRNTFATTYTCSYVDNYKFTLVILFQITSRAYIMCLSDFVTAQINCFVLHITFPSHNLISSHAILASKYIYK